jgi:hypothetical protein
MMTGMYDKLVQLFWLPYSFKPEHEAHKFCQQIYPFVTWQWPTSMCMCIWGRVWYRAVPGTHVRLKLEQWAGTKNVAEFRWVTKRFQISVAIGTSKKIIRNQVIFGEKSGIHEFRIRAEFPFIAFCPNQFEEPSSAAERNTNPIRSSASTWCHRAAYTFSE